MISDQDLVVIEAQIGRAPRGAVAVEKRCPVGHPQVIRVYPLVDGEPFPTLFWLSCPNLVTQISRLEHQGFIEKIENLIAQDVDFRNRYCENHHEYIHERWLSLTADDRSLIEKKGYKELFLKCGIGGIKKWETVKCLHLHYAHHLARQNVIGQWIDENFKIEVCK